MDMDDWSESDDDFMFARPCERRDQEDEAEAWYNHPIRVQNRRLMEENMRLKRLLREHGVSWNPLLTLDPNDPTHARGYWSSESRKRVRTRSSRGPAPLTQENGSLPTLPVEIQLYILEYAMTSKYPIIDPLCKLNRDSTTTDERTCGNQLAIGFLATCKTYLVEGSRFLWRNNKFVFTSPQALRNLENLSLEHRKSIEHVTLRIIARYYDDEDRPRLAPYPSLGYEHRKTVNLKVIQRNKEPNLTRKGFHSYSWLQLMDFLKALRPPHDPSQVKLQPRARLLPELKSLRMDFVNFPANFLMPPAGESLHDLVAHDLGCTLNELQLTGIPCDPWGHEVAGHLSGMVKDDGLLLKSDSTFVYSGNRLRTMSDRLRWDSCWDPKVVRAWKVVAQEHARKNNLQPSRSHHHGHTGSIMPPAPEEEGHPESRWKERPTIFKRVPLSQTSEARVWREFDRLTGQPISHLKYDPDKDKLDLDPFLCTHCGLMHSPLWDDA
ncbi:hypothetical protein VTK56DRAFT_5060 [Thermocarpiscus australiensis]